MWSRSQDRCLFHSPGSRSYCGAHLRIAQTCYDNAIITFKLRSPVNFVGLLFFLKLNVKRRPLLSQSVLNGKLHSWCHSKDNVTPKATLRAKVKNILKKYQYY